jgi:hypothetical protein
MNIQRGANYKVGDLIIYQSKKTWVQAQVTKVNPKSIRIEDGKVNGEGLFVPSGVVNKSNNGNLNFLSHRIFTYVVGEEKYTAEGLDQEIRNKRYSYEIKWKSSQQNAIRAEFDTRDDLEMWMDRKEPEWRENIPLYIFDYIVDLNKKLTPPKMPIMDEPAEHQTHREPVVETPKPIVVGTSEPVTNDDWLTNLKAKFEDLCVSEFFKDLGNITLETIQNYLISDMVDSELTQRLKAMVSKWTKFGKELNAWINAQPDVETTLIEHVPFKGKTTMTTSISFKDYILRSNSSLEWLFTTDNMDEEVTELEVEMFDHKGVAYLMDKNGNLYMDDDDEEFDHPKGYVKLGVSVNLN